MERILVHATIPASPRFMHAKILRNWIALRRKIAEATTDSSYCIIRLSDWTVPGRALLEYRTSRFRDERHVAVLAHNYSQIPGPD